MALVIKDRVKQTTTTTGTGTLTLNGTVDGFQTFAAALSDGDTTYYALLEPSTNEWEVGLGTWTEGSSLLARTTVLASSNSGSAVNLTAQAEVFISQPAGKAAFFNADGDLDLSRDPQTALQAATKQYVDTIAAAGIHYHDPVRVESPSNLNATYDNGTAGVGATLTNAGTQAAITIDGVALSSADRVLVYNQTNAAHNGIYTVTTVGSGSTNWVLTRATDADSYGASDPDSLGEGDAFFVKEGDTGAGELYVMNTSGTITFGTTNITFTVIAETAVYSAGNGITLTGTTFAADAGTGVTVDGSGINIGQAVETTSDVTFNTVSAALTGNVTGNVTGDVTGNADTATALQTARNIGGVSFDGTASINLPGVNTTGNQDTTGNAATATAWATGRTISLTGDVTGSVTGVDGTGNASIATTIAANSVALGTDTTGNYVTSVASGNYITGGAAGSEGATLTIGVDATPNNTASKVVARDASGNFSAGTITATSLTVDMDTLHVDSTNNRVGIGTASPSSNLHVLGSTADVFRIERDASNDWRFQLTSGAVAIRDATVDAERLRIDASGNLLVGTTTYNSANQGILLGATGVIYSTGTSGISASFGRNTTDGSIVNFRKDNTTVGSIGTNSGNPYFIKNTGGIQVQNTRLLPADSSGAGSDGASDLGRDTSRWKDLYLSGNISVGGTVDGRDVASDGSKLDGIESGATGDQTASEILTAIKTVDGSGSGLDADTLDGVQGSSYLRSDTSDNFTTLTGTTVNATNFYANDWFRNYNSGEGLYNEANAMHFASYGNTSYAVYSNQSNTRLEIRTSGNVVRGSVYGDNSNQIGFLDSDGNWAIRHVRDSRTEFLINNSEKMELNSQGLFLHDGSLAEDYDALSGTTPTCNVDNGGAFSLTMSGNTTFTFSGAAIGYSQGFVLQLTGNGSTVTWPSSVKWAGGTAPDAPASGETDILVFHTRDGGTNWYGVLASDAAA